MKSHLEFANQTYLQHLQDSMTYSVKSLKASLYFFIHGLFPNYFESSGSQTIEDLNTILKTKLEEISKTASNI
jgi:hypothetical protein